MNIFVNKINDILRKAIKELDYIGEIIIERPKLIQDADFATNFALINAKKNNLTPLEIAEAIVKKIQKNEMFEKVEFVKPGFINFRINKPQFNSVIKEINILKENYGKSKRKNFLYNLELVSANPTGFLHVGHARNGAIGDSVARILKFAGYDVQTEYYTNDAGNQINISATTLFYYYKKKLGCKIDAPDEMYGGDMYLEIAQKFVDNYGNKFIEIEIENNKINNKEVNEIFKSKSIFYFMHEIKKQLKSFDINIDYYSSEAKMYEKNMIEDVIKKYQELDKTYLKDNALWLKTTLFGDDKDRVLKKTDGSYTYITPDIASHVDRIKRTLANKYVNLWGGDHHGYIIRLRSGLALLGYDFNLLDIDMIQMVRLIKDGKEFKMSKRKGTAVWLIDLLEMVGKDAIRYMLVSKTPSSHMDFDLDLAIEKNSVNPVYYAQYATARSKKIIISFEEKLINIEDLDFNFETQKEREIIIHLDSFNSTVEYAANYRLPNIICDYIQNLSKLFHSYYAETKIIDENIEKTSQKIWLVKSIYQILTNAFNLVGISVKDEM